MWNSLAVVRAGSGKSHVRAGLAQCGQRTGSWARGYLGQGKRNVISEIMTLSEGKG